ncbi:DUF2283 domain-containing protein [Actinokineospora sp. NBRC 105648]|uniref:DUF2283 domain-containing protein n=1 Tax=Actinokineospora sp. NBRC 105648 TaxID=3032206 RepID=UPI0024A2BE9F|nr:DUF2283 domain-containing protein [Actinokineospora sp. NBRC 105648]GLZ41219.1 hypothetical protein Acsp05_48430 [Actinokineospora sp. NBRC 105648]
MTTSQRISLEIDQEAGAAYLQFLDSAVTRSVEFSDSIVVDLDEHDVAVGIEVLDLNISVPLDELAAKHHIRTESLAVLVQALRSSSPANTYAAGSHAGPGLPQPRILTS